MVLGFLSISFHDWKTEDYIAKASSALLQAAACKLSRSLGWTTAPKIYKTQSVDQSVQYLVESRNRRSYSFLLSTRTMQSLEIIPSLLRLMKHRRHFDGYTLPPTQHVDQQSHIVDTGRGVNNVRVVKVISGCVGPETKLFSRSMTPWPERILTKYNR